MANTTTTMPATPSSSGARKAEPKLYGLMAEFATPADIYHAAERVRDAGYKWWDCHTPFPVHGLDKAMGIKPTILPVIVFFGGLTGAIIATLLQVLTNGTNIDLSFAFLTGYQFPISGKPPVSGPAFVPVAFELTVLLSALTTVGALLILNGLPQHYHPLFRSKRFHRATDDRFFLVIEARDPKFSRGKTEELLHALHPVAIEAVEA